MTADMLIEEGAAFLHFSGLEDRARASAAAPERFEVIVIGGGQAGLSVGYHLARQGIRFVILDAAARIGDTWRNRWDSLRLFSPRYLDGLDGMPFPGAPRDGFPTKDEMADYLEAYAARFELPVRSGMQVERLSRQGERYQVRAGKHVFEADQVVIAIGNYQRACEPEWAKQLEPGIVRLHSTHYRNPSQLQSGPVLVVGAGNSGAEIALELNAHHPVLISGRNQEVPFRITSWLGRNVFSRLLMRVMFHRVLTLDTPMGRKARPRMLHQTTPLIRTKISQLTAAGVESVARVVGVREGKPLLEDGRVLEVANVVFCTGFEPGFSWIDLPILDEGGEPQHQSGLVERAPGVYFVGLHFLHAMSSGMIHGVGRDAARIARTIVTARAGVR